MTTIKIKKLRKRQRRVKKLRALKAKYYATNDQKERKRILEKIRKISIYPEKEISNLKS